MHFDSLRWLGHGFFRPTIPEPTPDLTPAYYSHAVPRKEAITLLCSLITLPVMVPDLPLPQLPYDGFAELIPATPAHTPERGGSEEKDRLPAGSRVFRKFKSGVGEKSTPVAASSSSSIWYTSATSPSLYSNHSAAIATTTVTYSASTSNTLMVPFIAATTLPISKENEFVHNPSTPRTPDTPICLRRGSTRSLDGKENSGELFRSVAAGRLLTPSTLLILPGVIPSLLVPPGLDSGLPVAAVATGTPSRSLFTPSPSSSVRPNTNTASFKTITDVTGMDRLRASSVPNVPLGLSGPAPSEGISELSCLLKKDDKLSKVWTVYSPHPQRVPSTRSPTCSPTSTPVSVPQTGAPSYLNSSAGVPSYLNSSAGVFVPVLGLSKELLVSGAAAIGDTTGAVINISGVATAGEDQPSPDTSQTPLNTEDLAARGAGGVPAAGGESETAGELQRQLVSGLRAIAIDETHTVTLLFYDVTVLSNMLSLSSMTSLLSKFDVTLSNMTLLL